MNDFLFAEEVVEETKVLYKPWKILISDDEKEIHTITKIVLSNFIFENRKIEILDAYTRKETIEILEKNRDVALVILDVVMETDDAGLLAVKDIREKLKNNLIRIVLRTGQPGSAPEKDVIAKYDINDYKEKTELTTTKLFTTVMTAIRSYRDLETIEKNEQRLEKVLKATNQIIGIKSIKLFSEKILEELTSILTFSNNYIGNTHVGGFLVDVINNNYKINYSNREFTNLKEEEILTNDIKKSLDKAMEIKNSYYDKKSYVGYFKNNEHMHLIYLKSNIKIEDNDKKIIDIFVNNAAVALNNIYLTKEIIDTQKEIIETLGEVVEKRSKETSTHVYRVAQISRIIALKLGMSEEEADTIAMCSPLHDVGKTAISDTILLKPGKLTIDEYEDMKKHTEIGRDILGSSTRPLLKTGSIIAYEHHEKWNGTGYPNQKKGKEIHIYGRITAIADVFDALYHKRCYKEAWPLDEIIKLIENERGEHFDPQIADIFLNNIDEILEKTIINPYNSNK